ncbi:hypothetical protein DPV78_010817 [Talaromyces pinophilus]|nr:hypothetical protein DPV78_010817 [Talaromyces pinophilus]
MLDKRYGDLLKPHHDSNMYTLGSIGKHNIVIACLLEGRYGMNAAANVMILLAGIFPSVRSYLMVGIGGGIPSNKVRLGDVMDIGRAKPGCKFEWTDALDSLPKALLTALAKLKTDNKLNGSNIPMYLNNFKNRYPKAVEKYLRSNSLIDILFKASYNHVTPVKLDKNDKGEDSDDSDKEEEEEKEEKDIQETLNEIAVGQKQRAIFKWLSPLSPSTRHFENQKKRVKHTGTWLLKEPKFLDWSSKIAKCRVLCCYGDPEARKTIISLLIFLTGHPYVWEIVQEYFKGEYNITIEAHEKISSPNDIEPKAIDKKLRMDILKKVVDSAKGMLVSLHLASPAISAAYFANLCYPLSYDLIAGGEDYCLLTINELLCLLAIQDSDTCFNLRGIPVREILLNCCYSLVAQWHSKIAHTCLTFLKFLSLTAGEALEQNHTIVTILRYAVTQWGHHLRRSEELLGVALEFGKEYLLANCTNHSRDVCIPALRDAA